MSPHPSGDRRELLLLTLCALFVGFFVTAELLGAKLWDFTLFVPVHPPEPDAIRTKQDVLRAVGRAD